MPSFAPCSCRPGADVYWGEPGASSLKYAADIHVGKLGTDVALVGSGTRRRRAIAEMLARERRRRRKVARGGDRLGAAPSCATPPAPFASMPSFTSGRSGRDQDGPQRPRSATRWSGFSRVRRLRSGAGVRLPNIETRTGLAHAGDRPPPRIRLVAPSWQPRRRGGTYDDAWRRIARRSCARLRSALRNAASAGLTFEDGLHGGEPITLDGVSRAGALQSVVRDPAAVEVAVAGSRETPPMKLETILIEPRRPDVVDLARAPCDKRALRIERIHIREERAPCVHVFVNGGRRAWDQRA